MVVVAQIRAMLWLAWKHWSRSSLFNPREGPKLSPRTVTSGVLLRALFVLFVGHSFWKTGTRVAELTLEREAAASWLLAGALLVAFSAGFALQYPVRKAGKLFSLDGPCLDALPVTTSARLLTTLLQSAALLIYCVAALLGAGGLDATAGGLAVLLAILALVITAALSGVATTYALRLGVSAHRLLRLKWVIYVPALLGILGVMLPGFLADTWGTPVALAPLSPWVRLIVGEAPGDMLPSLSLLGAVAVAAAALPGYAERRGYDRIESAAAPKASRATRSFDLASIERLLSRRESGLWVFPLALIAALAGGLFVALDASTGAERGAAFSDWVITGLNLMVAQLGAIMALTRANRSVVRDVHARPLLASLPVEPRDTLAGKVPLIRLQVMLLLLVYAPVFALVPGAMFWHAAGRVTALALGLWLLCSAAVNVAFLSGGLGSPTPGALGTPFNLHFVLLMLPILGVAAADSLLAALPPLCGLGLLVFESRRAALRAVRWFDDASENVQRDTQVWRALLVFAAFSVTQSLVGRVLAIAWHDPLSVTAASYILSAAVLLLLTASRRPATLSVRWWPRNGWAIPLGLVIGVGSGVLAHGYLWILGALGRQAPVADVQSLALGARVSAALAIVLVAPIAEEAFFRGWLQQAVEGELSASKKGWSVVLTALAFAVIHPPISFAPVFVLGLSAGHVYRHSRALSACIAVHMAHNAVALWLQ